jgi:TusA-related sulfurtransferase
MKAKNIDLDVRGLSCPEPVIRTKRMLDHVVADTLTVLADSYVAAENIRRLVTNAGLTCSATEEDGEFLITISGKV